MNQISKETEPDTTNADQPQQNYQPQDSHKFVDIIIYRIGNSKPPLNNVKINSMEFTYL